MKYRIQKGKPKHVFSKNHFSSILISPTRMGMAVVSQMALLNPHLCGAQLA